jgi:anti-anti-sigma factor
MLRDRGINRDHGGTVFGTSPAAYGPGAIPSLPTESKALARLRVRSIERTALVRFADTGILFDEETIRSVGAELDRLIVDEGHTRMLLNFAGVQYMSGSMLGRLAGLRTKLPPPKGHIQLCGLEPLMRDLLRISGLDRVLEVCTDEAEALGLVLL